MLVYNFMTNLPSNLYFIVTDNSIEDLSHKYIIVEGKVTEDIALKNRERLQVITAAPNICFNHQVHGNEIYYADWPHPLGLEPYADGFYTDKKGLFLAVMTADCVPVLFYSQDGAWIGAAHAGWKGAKANILANLYEKMSKQASDISAIIGPCIHQKSYEVDRGFYDNFLVEDSQNEVCFVESSNENHFMFDLPAYVDKKLSLLGIENIHKINEDTYSTKLGDGRHKYPSYRRHTHNTENYPQSIVTGIMIKP